MGGCGEFCGKFKDNIRFLIMEFIATTILSSIYPVAVRLTVITYT